MLTYDWTKNGGQVNRKLALGADGADSHIPVIPVVSRGRCNTGLQFIRRSSKSQGLSWSGIETQSDCVEF